jgi:predicted metalloprotease
MRMEDERESRNVEDRRGQRGGLPGLGLPRGLPGAGMPRSGGGAGRLGGLGLVAVLLISLFLGVDPGALLSGLDGGAPPPRQEASYQGRAPAPPAQDAEARFVSRVLASTEDVWTAEFARAGQRYEPPRLVLFEGAVQSGCGYARAAQGPFYCPADQRVYIDLAFFRDMERRLGAGGDFAQAYVIAHEVGHHVQNLLGILPRAHRAQQQAGEREANAISVALELQADCLAGFWARRADEMRRILEQGDIEEGLNAASSVGDDRLQRAAGQRVTPDSFTHGTSAQRVAAFRRGLEASGPNACLNRN